MRHAVLFVLLASVSAPAMAQSTTAFGALRKDRPSAPYQSLFDVQAPARQQQLQQPALTNQAGATKRRTVCGLTVIEVDKSLDPKMVAGPKDDAATRQSAREVPTSFWAFCGPKQR